MCRSAVVVAGNRFVGTGTEFDDHLFHFTNQQHVGKQVEGLVIGESTFGQFRFQAATILERADLAAVDLERLELRTHVAEVCR